MLGDQPPALVEGHHLVALPGRVPRRLVGAQRDRHRPEPLVRRRPEARRRLRPRRRRLRELRSHRRLREPGRHRRLRERRRHRRLRPVGGRRGGRSALSGKGAQGRLQLGLLRSGGALLDVAGDVGLHHAAARARALHLAQVEAVLLRHVASHRRGANAVVCRGRGSGAVSRRRGCRRGRGPRVAAPEPPPAHPPPRPCPPRRAAPMRPPR